MKTATGNFFEDFTLGMRLVHATRALDDEVGQPAR